MYRLYTPADFEQLYTLEEVCFEPPSRFSRRFMRLLVQYSCAATWIAEEAGQIMGFAIIDWTEEADEATSYIQTVEVSPEARGRGVGRELLNRIEGSARLADARSICLHVEEGNAAAVRLYEAQGFRCEGREEDYYPSGRAGLIYIKRLDAEAAS
ncbi:MAG: GNAT family N-acetyltransferase [Terracidiphilus sp.]|jgi:ribosomal protein S18 acetylase RimI-like enzyme